MVPFVPASAESHLAAGTVLSRWRGALRVTVVCKATLAFASDAEMAFAPPVALVDTDVHAAKNPMRSVRVSADLSPHLERADVIFVGRAHAPPGTRVERMTVRLALLDESGPVLDKRLVIVGDRDGAGGAPRPFDAMPLVYERAYGGLRSPDNPLGVGVGGDGIIEPNILDPDPTRARTVAGFGPRSTSWPVRKKLLRGHPRPPIEGVIELPDDFDWIYFQAAPPDQWLDALPARAWLVLEGLNARSPRLRMRLPTMRVWSRLQGPGLAGGAATQPVELRPDTLFIDGDAEHCTVAFRGSFTVPGVEALADAWASVAMETPGRPLVWPARPAAPPPRAAAPGGPGAVAFAGSAAGAWTPRRDLGGTLPLDDRPRPTGATRMPAQGSSGTMVVDGDALAAAARESQRQPAAGTMILEAPPTDPPRAFGTMIVEAPPAAAQPLPFVGGGATRTRGDTSPPLPGAPWAPGASPRTPTRAPNPLAETLAPASTFAPGAVREAELARAERERRAEELRRADELRASEAARAREEAESRARRQAERDEDARIAAERFAREQAAARKTEAEKAAAEAAERARAIQDLKKKAYGGFDD